MSNVTRACPVTMNSEQQVLMAHGGGGTLMHGLIETMFRAKFSNPLLDQGHDGAVLELGGQRLAMSTDSFVVSPLIFPGGDIGSLAVHGTVNDLAMCGATPLFLSVGFIIEEGLAMNTLDVITTSMHRAARDAGVRIITGDTKVVDHGKGDGLFINTAGIGSVSPGIDIGPHRVQAGDVVIVNGDIGRHGVAIMAQREGLEFESTIESDAASLNHLVHELLDANLRIHCMRDLTRGGLISALNEIASASRLTIDIEESATVINDDVRGACELLGLDPLGVACEGRCVMFCPQDSAAEVLDILRRDPLGRGATRIGTVTSEPGARVTLTSTIGPRRVLQMLSGEQLPRIC